MLFETLCKRMKDLKYHFYVKLNGEMVIERAKRLPGAFELTLKNTDFLLEFSVKSEIMVNLLAKVPSRAKSGCPENVYGGKCFVKVFRNS